MEEKDIGTLAAEKIAAQMKEATEKLKGEKGGGVAAARRAMKLVLIEEIGKMISKFCYTMSLLRRWKDMKRLFLMWSRRSRRMLIRTIRACPTLWHT